MQKKKTTTVIVDDAKATIKNEEKMEKEMKKEEVKVNEVKEVKDVKDETEKREIKREFKRVNNNIDSNSTFKKDEKEKVFPKKEDFQPSFTPKAAFNATGNVAYGTEAERIVSQTLNKIANSVASSLGPYGSMSIIESSTLDHQITKDGYSILSRICFKESIPRIVCNLIKKVAENQVRKVGDGTTSSILIATSLYHSLKNFKTKYNVSNAFLNKAIEKMKKIIMDYLEEQGNPYVAYFEDLEEESKKNCIDSVATIASNNDSSIIKLINKAYASFKNFEGIVIPEKSLSENDELIVKNGFETSATFIDNAFTNENGKVARYENPKVLMVDGTIDDYDMDALAEVLEFFYAPDRRGRKIVPFIIIANKFTPTVRDAFLVQNRKQNKLPIVAISMSTATKYAKGKFYDLAAYIGATPIKKGENESLYATGSTSNIDLTSLQKRFGSCKKIVVDERFSTFIEGAGSKNDIEVRLKEIDDEILMIKGTIDEFDHNNELHQLQKRKLAFANGISIIKVGGETEAEKDSRFYLLDDAILAVKSMIESGFVTGGNLIIPKIISDKNAEIFNEFKKEKIFNSDKEINDFISCFNNSFLKSFGKVLLNYFEKIEGEEDNKASWKILDFVRKLIANNKMIDLNLFKQKTIDFQPDESYHDFESSYIINPLDTEIEILKSSLSIVSLLINSSQFVLMGFIE